MTTMPDAAFFKNNRTRLLERCNEAGLIIIAANGLTQRSGDTTYPFRQDSNFLYLTGLGDVADAFLVIDTQTSEEFLVLRDKLQSEVIFEGAYNCDKIAKISGIGTILSEKEGRQKLKELRKSRNKVYTIKAPPRYVYNFYTNPARRRLMGTLARLGWGTKSIVDIRAPLAQLRQVKQPEEVEALKHAIAITRAGFAEVSKQLKPGMYEYEVQALFDYVFRTHNTGHGYAPPIIAGGKNACTLHYSSNQSKLRAETFLLMDVGAEYHGYSADISRTYQISAHVTKRQAAVFQAVHEAAKQVTAAVRVGMSWKQYYQVANEIVGKQLVGLGLIAKNTPAEVRRYFPHAVGHSLGLDAHDPHESALLQENMVITVEPGIYIPEEGIGVRVEDDILITPNGAVNLSQDIPYS